LKEQRERIGFFSGLFSRFFYNMHAFEFCDVMDKKNNIKSKAFAAQ